MPCIFSLGFLPAIKQRGQYCDSPTSEIGTKAMPLALGLLSLIGVHCISILYIWHQYPTKAINVFPKICLSIIYHWVLCRDPQSSSKMDAHQGDLSKGHTQPGFILALGKGIIPKLSRCLVCSGLIFKWTREVKYFHEMNFYFRKGLLEQLLNLGEGYHGPSPALHSAHVLVSGYIPLRRTVSEWMPSKLIYFIFHNQFQGKDNSGIESLAKIIGIYAYSFSLKFVPDIQCCQIDCFYFGQRWLWFI